jgi:hypothetical protein
VVLATPASGNVRSGVNCFNSGANMKLCCSNGVDPACDYVDLFIQVNHGIQF